MENPITVRQYCSRQFRGERFKQCQIYLQQDQSPYESARQQEKDQGLQQCCQELQRLDDLFCVCEAVTKVFEVMELERRLERQQGGEISSQQMLDLRKKAQNLPKKCNIQTRQCLIRPRITTIASNEEKPSIFSRVCRKIVQIQPLNQCQRFIAQQIRHPRTILMAINKQGQEPQGLQQCCNELKKMRKECQCEAMKDVYNKVIQQQRQQRSEYGSKRKQMEHVMQQVGQVMQYLPNQCGFDVDECRIPSEIEVLS